MKIWKMKNLVQITSMCPLFVKKDALKWVHTSNTLSLFLKNYVLISQFSGIHSSLECIIIICMCVCTCVNKCVYHSVCRCVFEQTSRLIIKILSMKPDFGILRQWSASYNSSQTKVYQTCFIDRCMINWPVKQACTKS